MNVALALAGALLGSHGWQTYVLEEGGISLASTAPFALVASGADADTPQSVERSVWRSQTETSLLTVTYDRWRSPQFDPDKSLDIFSRRVLGVMAERVIEQTELDGLPGAVLLLGSRTSPTRAVLRVKSGPESWQIDIKPMEGALASEEVERVRSSVQISTEKGEPPTDPWGNLVQRVTAPPRPRPGPQGPTHLKSARLALSLPFAVKESKGQRSPEDRSSYLALSEWGGKEEGKEAAITYIKLRPGQTIDLSGWVAAYGETLRDEGFTQFEPAIEDFAIPGATARMIRGEATQGAKRLSIQIVLILRGPEAWAVQTRLDADSDKGIEKSVLSSLRLDKQI
jgi:hypothetical protein